MDSNEITDKAALEAWHRSRRDIRVQAAHAGLRALGKLATLMTPNDRIDAARSVWIEFIDGQDSTTEGAKLTHHEITEQAKILAALTFHLGEGDIVPFAADAWGDRSFAAHCEEGVHLAWYPEDHSVIVTRTLNGVTTVLALSPGRVQGRVL